MDERAIFSSWQESVAEQNLTYEIELFSKMEKQAALLRVFRNFSEN
jgi:hypothetical protein